MRQLIFTLLALTTPPALAATQWTFSVPVQSSGSFTSSESTNSVTVAGTYIRQANGFIQMTVTSSSGALAPSNGTVKYAIEVPGFAFVAQPFLTNEKRLILTTGVGTCPTESFTGVLGFSIWSGTAGTSTDVSNPSTPAFGIISWNPATNQASVTNLRNLTAYATISGFAGFTLAGTCTNGVITFTGPGDRGGRLYLTDTRGGIYLTNTDRAILILPQKTIPSANLLNGTYAAWNYDDAFHTNITPIRMTVTGGTSASGDTITDLATGTTDTNQTWTMSSITVNSPINGVFTANLSLEGSIATRCACATYFRNKPTLFCVAQSPYLASRPMNFVMTGDTSPFSGLDTYAFSATGKVLTTIGGSTAQAMGMALQPDGKIVAAGFLNNDFATVRYRVDGSLDTSFSTDGMIVTSVGGARADRANAVAIDTTGKIIVAGYSNTNVGGDNFAVVRYTTAGVLDTAFSGDGAFITSITTNADRAQAIAVQSNNRIMAAGYSNNGANDDFATVRITTGGVLDTTWSGDGRDVRNINGGGADRALAIGLQSDGKAVVAGYDNNSFAILRYTTAGTLDNTFSGDGIQTLSSGTTNRAHALAIQVDGKILIGGYVTSGNDNFALVRYSSAGVLDASFDADGIVITSFSTTQADRIHSLALQWDGKIVAAGYVYNGTTNDFAVARYLSTGALDTTFDTDGKYSLDFTAGTANIANTLMIQPDYKYVVSGHSVSGGLDRFAVMRMWP